MLDASSFADVIRSVQHDLRREPLSPVRLNQAASRIDLLGRRLHGVGWTREHEIGGCLTVAVRELSQARGLPEMERTGRVREAIQQLETALTYSDEGLRP